MLKLIDREEDWMEFDLPLEIDLGRAFFAELLGVSESTKGVIAKISREHLRSGSQAITVEITRNC